jgi:hypothetical protein
LGAGAVRTVKTSARKNAAMKNAIAITFETPTARTSRMPKTTRATGANNTYGEFSHQRP